MQIEQPAQIQEDTILRDTIESENRKLIKENIEEKPKEQVLNDSEIARQLHE